MKLIIVRHGDPDYENDSLTEKGCREASLLADRLSELDIKAFYCSPLGRAQKTASYTLEKMGRTAETCGWLREFNAALVKDPFTGEDHIVWDQLPEYWTKIPEFYDKDKWLDTGLVRGTGIPAEAEKVCAGLDEVIARHGYRREGNYYRAGEPNKDIIVMFCHFGVTCVMLGHLLGISPMTLWHGAVTLPTSVTTLTTEERREGIAYFRMSGLGDISHLYAGREEPSFSARFCEIWSDMSERHD